jgi:hypothetical protein
MVQKGTIPFNSTYERIGGGTTTHWLGLDQAKVYWTFCVKGRKNSKTLGVSCVYVSIEITTHARQGGFSSEGQDTTTTAGTQAANPETIG